MSKIESIVTHILDTQPHTHGNNTEIYIAVLKYVLEARGHSLPYEVAQAIRDYKPESVPRKRREIKESTKAQHEKGYEVYKHYATGVGSNPLD
jgi:hypothetical protein